MKLINIFVCLLIGGFIAFITLDVIYYEIFYVHYILWYPGGHSKPASHGHLKTGHLDSSLVG